VSDAAGASIRHGRRWKHVRLAVTLMVAGSFAALLATGLNADLESRPDPLEGQPAPAFVLPTLSGRTLASRDLRGKVVVVNFFASWCIACRQEHAALASVWAANGRDVVVLGVAFQDSAGNVRAWRKEMGAQWPIVLDDDSRTAIDFGVAGVPETYVIAANGTIAHRFIGPVQTDALQRSVEIAREAGDVR
jgi:cytochrome c biogenesis protein CcmG/thiol:disulfide interchange protein DsbE